MSDEYTLEEGVSPIICPRTTDMPRPNAAARSMHAACGDEVWVAQSSLDMLESDLQVVLICMKHAIPALERYKREHPEEPIQMRMAPGAKEEVRKEFEAELNIPIPTLSEEEYDEAVGVDK